MKNDMNPFLKHFVTNMENHSDIQKNGTFSFQIINITYVSTMFRRQHKNSEYDQEIPQSQTAEKPVAK